MVQHFLGLIMIGTLLLIQTVCAANGTSILPPNTVRPGLPRDLNITVNVPIPTAEILPLGNAVNQATIAAQQAPQQVAMLTGQAAATALLDAQHMGPPTIPAPPSAIQRNIIAAATAASMLFWITLIAAAQDKPNWYTGGAASGVGLLAILLTILTVKTQQALIAARNALNQVINTDPFELRSSSTQNDAAAMAAAASDAQRFAMALGAGTAAIGSATADTQHTAIDLDRMGGAAVDATANNAARLAMALSTAGVTALGTATDAAQNTTATAFQAAADATQSTATILNASAAAARQPRTTGTTFPR